MTTVDLQTTGRANLKNPLNGMVRFAIVAGLLAATGCTNLDRSRNWGNENVPGKVLVQQVCSTCHGIDGQSVNTLFPKLAGQQKDYILAQLEAIQSRDRYSDHTRQFMWGPGRYLTAKQRGEIADYFSSLPAMKAGRARPPASDRGQIIYTQGIPEAGTDSCASCHGDKGQGDANVPRLAGQHQYYLKSRARNAMALILANVSDADIAEVSAYLESIGEGGAAPAPVPAPDPEAATLKAKAPKVDEAAIAAVPPVFDAQGDPKNCHYSVWTYGWYCGSFVDALVYHLKNQ
jgi:cytochrome c553